MDQEVKAEVPAGSTEPTQKARKSKKETTKKPSKRKRGRSRPARRKASGGTRPYPRVTLEEALRIPTALREKNGGNPWPPGDVAAAVGMSPTTPNFFYLAAGSRDYGLTEGSRDSATISLTELGRRIVYPKTKDEEQESLREALLKIEIFGKVLDHYHGSNLPEMKYLGNTLKREYGLDESFHAEFSKLFGENCAFLGIGSGFSPQKPGLASGKQRDAASTVVMAEPKTKSGLRCFVVMPFRERESSRPRGFFDEVLKALIAPAGRDAGFEVLTANRDGSDVIQATIVNQLLDADLVVADLTENNPNVLFELGMRIAEDKPIALIRAKGTPPIFDIDNMLRVYDYDPNLWPTTVEHDLPKLIDHIKAAWDHRESNRTYLKILRERKDA